MNNEMAVVFVCEAFCKKVRQKAKVPKLWLKVTRFPFWLNAIGWLDRFHFHSHQ